MKRMLPESNKECALRTRDPRNREAYVVDGHLGLTHMEAQRGRWRLGDGGVGTAKTVKRPPQQPAQSHYANYWASLTHKWHNMPHPAQPRHTNHWAPRTWKRHQREHRPQRPTQRSDPTQHVKGRAGDCPGPRKRDNNQTECHTGWEGGWV